MDENKMPDVIPIKTESGFCCSVDSAVFDDYEFIESMTDLRDGDMFATVSVTKKILSADAYNRLKEHVRKDGKVKNEDMFKEIADIWNGIIDSKKK